jgi:cytochrome c-type protein NapC
VKWTEDRREHFLTTTQQRDQWREVDVACEPAGKVLALRAICPDCHVPKEWVPKIIRKIQASNELLHKALGSIDTPEKFQAKRARLAEHEWARMKANDSQECRNCHNYQYMDFTEQGARAVRTHSVAFSQEQTCIDCHKGIAHQLPPIEQEIGAPKPDAAKVR